METSYNPSRHRQVQQLKPAKRRARYKSASRIRMRSAFQRTVWAHSIVLYMTLEIDRQREREREREREGERERDRERGKDRKTQR